MFATTNSGEFRDPGDHSTTEQSLPDTVTPVYRSGTLLGVDYTELGEVGFLEITHDLAIAISRGRFPKGYPHTEPNEDAVFAGTDGAVSVLAVADGHRGSWASHTAIETIARLTEETIGEPDFLEYLLGTTKTAVNSTTDNSDTALAVLVARPGRVEVAQFGDTASFASDNTTAEVRVGKAGFLRRSSADDRLEIVAPAGMLGVVTDGVTSFVPSSLDSYVTGDGERTGDYARRLVEEAFQGGAGDNIAVAVCGDP